MTRLTLEEHLASAPPSVRRAMLADRQNLLRGAAAVTGRFYAEMKARQEPEDYPSAKTFRRAARSEASLRTLLVTLERYAPRVSTAAGREVRAERYAARSGKSRGDAPQSAAPLLPDIGRWPPLWQSMVPGLLAAKLSESSKRRYCASLSRLVRIQQALDLPPDPSFYLAFSLAEALEADGVRQRSIAGYLDALIAIAKHGGAPAKGLNGLRRMRDLCKQRAKMQGKRKTDRIRDLMERGGFEEIIRTVAELSDQAAKSPPHSSRHEASLRAAVLIGLHVNKPGRTGDVASWQIGRELTRTPDGVWELSWEQQKTDIGTGAGALWPEICELLDAWILGGRPDRFVHLRYRELLDQNWLTLSTTVPPSKYPSEIIKRHIGVPSHDLRTLAADYLRHHDPASAGNVIAAHLGHRSRQAGEEYRALAESDTAARAWLDIREKIRSGTP
ncbi:hypothetical protein [Thioclava nitratireducens]|uniref:hypothetical protein n=1 Tax=Thioclava nitratireducens TaxID=1915078 RepID=UPI002480F088|nr:hypothetical protein [Thioclava nitratireducens]WGT50427.1 hypothetical protein P0N61_19370 [Thioclava nitratireducens]